MRFLCPISAPARRLVRAALAAGLLALAAPAAAGGEQGDRTGTPGGGWADEVKRSLDRPGKPADKPQGEPLGLMGGGAKPQGGEGGPAMPQGGSPLPQR